MKITKMKGYSALALGLALVLGVPQPGFGVIPVFDGASYAEMGHIWSQNVSTNTKLLEEIAQLEKIYASGIQTYNLAQAMAHSFGPGQKMQWITIAQMAVKDYADDQAAKGWGSAVSGNPAGVPSAWKLATMDISNGAYLAARSPGVNSSIARMASVAMVDGSSQKCLQTISQYRGNSLQNQLGPVLKLAIAHMDGTSATNSQIEQLNLLNAHGEQANNEFRAQGQINACAVEQQIIANKMARDQQVEELTMLGTANQAFNSFSVEDTGAVMTAFHDR